MEHDTPGFARILEEYGSVSWDFRAATRPFSRSDQYFCFNFCHENVGKGDRHFSAHGSAVYLQVVFPVELK